MNVSELRRRLLIMATGHDPQFLLLDVLKTLKSCGRQDLVAALTMERIWSPFNDKSEALLRILHDVEVLAIRQGDIGVSSLIALVLIRVILKAPAPRSLRHPEAAISTDSSLRCLRATLDTLTNLHMSAWSTKIFTDSVLRVLLKEVEHNIVLAISAEERTRRLFVHMCILHRVLQSCIREHKENTSTTKEGPVDTDMLASLLCAMCASVLKISFFPTSALNETRSETSQNKTRMTKRARIAHHRTFKTRDTAKSSVEQDIYDEEGRRSRYEYDSDDSSSSDDANDNTIVTDVYGSLDEKFMHKHVYEAEYEVPTSLETLTILFGKAATALNERSTDSKSLCVCSALSAVFTDTILQECLLAKFIGTLAKSVTEHIITNTIPAVTKSLPKYPIPPWTGYIKKQEKFIALEEFLQPQRKWHAMRRLLASLCKRPIVTLNVTRVILHNIRDTFMHKEEDAEISCGTITSLLELCVGLVSHQINACVQATQEVQIELVGLIERLKPYDDDVSVAIDTSEGATKRTGIVRDRCLLRLLVAAAGYVGVHCPNTAHLLLPLIGAQVSDLQRQQFLELMHPTVSFTFVAYMLPAMGVYCDAVILTELISAYDNHSTGKQNQHSLPCGNDLIRLDYSIVFYNLSQMRHNGITQWPLSSKGEQNHATHDLESFGVVPPNIHTYTYSALCRAQQVMCDSLLHAGNVPLDRSTELNNTSSDFHAQYQRNAYPNLRFAFPQYLISRVLPYLSARQLCRCSIASKHMLALCMKNQLWATLYCARFDKDLFYAPLPTEPLSAESVLVNTSGTHTYIGFNCDNSTGSSQSSTPNSISKKLYEMAGLQLIKTFHTKKLKSTTSTEVATRSDSACNECSIALSTKIAQEVLLNTPEGSALLLLRKRSKRIQSQPCKQALCRHDWYRLYRVRHSAFLKANKSLDTSVCPVVGCAKVASSQRMICHIREKHPGMKKNTGKRR
jgi:hypothetical protein